MDTVTRLRLLVAPLVDAAGATLYDLELANGVLRITVDRPGGVDIELIGSLTRAISQALDVEDPIAGQYTLEVSSPGLERPLRTPEHWAGAVGALVTVKTRAGVEGDRRLKGTVLAVDGDQITIAPGDAEPGTARVLTVDDVERARTVFEWGPAPKPGSPKAKKSAPSAKKKAGKS